MPDENKLKVFARTNMTLFKSCVLCRHGETPANSEWGYCKHPNHFYTHGRHGRLPGTSHASMGCEDFAMKNKNLRQMVELGPYIELVPFSDAKVEQVGVEEVDGDNGSQKPAEMHFDGNPIDDDDSQTIDVHIDLDGAVDGPVDNPVDKPVEMHFDGNPIDKKPVQEHTP